ncbi:MAG: bifunctional DNA-binding transcriptional regulator/O6-methylguanine-DNA methyltransferase Ada [Proteobacteria bacterium]|nr:bifunctional DNA-binding transcriptional regulator/O6-methylguanine-DNA methyltransferase Ada [Pseudomonadota bacterium]
MDASVIDTGFWQAVQDRDAGADGRFVFAVTTTGIYCRPSCPSRHPRWENVRFFPLPQAAERAGFRACKRCRPNEASPTDRRLARIAKACRVLDEADEPMTLAALGRKVGIAPHHLQRLFTRVVGVSPRAYWDARRLRRLKGELRAGESVTSALYGAGYGSSSRLYEKSGASLGMTPARYRQGGAGERVTYAIVASQLGRLLVAATARGVAMVALGESDRRLEAELAAELPGALLARDDSGLGAWVGPLVKHLAGKLPHLDLPVDVRATAFQRQVWEALRTIPTGTTTTYRDLARQIGQPSAARAVARACATNPVAVVVPCHRVVRGDGALGGYRWGMERKQALLEREKRERSPTPEPVRKRA